MLEGISNRVGIRWDVPAQAQERNIQPISKQNIYSYILFTEKYITWQPFL